MVGSFTVLAVRKECMKPSMRRYMYKETQKLHRNSDFASTRTAGAILRSRSSTV